MNDKTARIRAKDFYNDFRDLMIVAEENKKVPRWMESGKKWTQFFTNKEDGILAQIADRYTQENIKYWKEWWKIDGVFSEEKKTDEDLKCGDQHTCWHLFHAIIEIENNCKTFIHEVYKLTFFNCPLKVGITYFTREKENEFAILENRVARILHNRNIFWKENSETEYLFIIVIGPEPLVYKTMLFGPDGERMSI